MSVLSPRAVISDAGDRQAMLSDPEELKEDDT